MNYLTDLFNKTDRLVDDTNENPEKWSPLVVLQLAEIFTIRENAKLYVLLNEELEHYQVTSLFSFFDQVYFEIKQVIEKTDTNTSWMCSEFDNYKEQHEIVIRMINSALNLEK